MKHIERKGTDCKIPVKGAGMVTIIFRQNRKFDLHVGRNMITFCGRVARQISRRWLKHPDFLQVKNLFIIKGV